MSSALEILFASAETATQLPGPTTSRACRLRVSDAPSPSSLDVRRAPRTRRRERSRPGCDDVLSFLQVPSDPVPAQCGGLTEANT